MVAGEIVITKPGNGHVGNFHLSFDKNALLPSLYGECNQHLDAIEKAMDVSIHSRGNTVSVQGKDASVEHVKQILQSLYRKLEKGQEIDIKDVEAAIRMVNDKQSGQSGSQNLETNSNILLRTTKKTIRPYTNRQADYLRALLDHEVCFALGPAGTGKTYMAVAVAVSMFLEGKVERIILSRPAVEAGEKLGFLPGDLKEKIDPYLRPLYDALQDMLPAEKVTGFLESGTFEIAPLAFMRGRTLSNACVILDEAQNTTATQMKMFLTRLGEKSRMMITGDLSQTDLPNHITSGLRDAWERLQGVPGLGFVQFGDGDVVRHPLAAAIVQAYEKSDSDRQLKLPIEITLTDEPPAEEGEYA